MFSLLHIDNNFFYKEILKNLSKEKEFQYYSAKTPERGIEILKNHDIDIVVTGLEFEDAGGEEFIRSLMGEINTSTPVIVLSSTEDVDLKNRLFELGITEYFSKDYFLDFLASYIRKLRAEDTIASTLKKLKIAVLDDNETHLATIQEYFENNQITQVDYYIHPKALMASQKQYNIYITDLVMPDISGENVIADIRSRNEYAVIIAVSSLNSISVTSATLSLGADDYITKPLSENLFMARIKANVRTYCLMEKLKEKNMKLEHLIKEDGLTGLYNHKSAMISLEREIERAQRYHTSLSLIMFDIDHFKSVNDKYGHHTGDEVLRKMGRYLKDISRDFDIAGRYGGEEFIVILPETDLRGAILYANRVRTEVEKMKFNEPDLKITISGGIGVYDNNSALDLVKKADSFLYEAKNSGRNRIIFE